MFMPAILVSPGLDHRAFRLRHRQTTEPPTALNGENAAPVEPMEVGEPAVSGAPPAGINTIPFSEAFAATDDMAKKNVEIMIAAIKAADYSNALIALSKMASTAKMTPEQEKALTHLIVQVQAHMSREQKEEAASELQKSLPTTNPPETATE